MANYANQHFLPKSYLQNFSNNSDNVHIGIYVTDKHKYIQSGPIKPQCRRLNYYGENGVTEKRLGVLESGFKKIMLKIIEDQKLPVPGTKEYDDMIYMWLITSLRNPMASETNQAIMKEISKQALKNPADVQPFIINSDTDFVGISLFFADIAIPAVKDLKAILLVNETSIPFITSDNPVNNYNQLAERMKIKSAVTGVASVGIQSFLPLNPTTMLMLYDPQIYKQNNPEKSKILLNVNEVFALNLLQLLNNISTLYFNQNMSKDQLNRLIEAGIGFDRPGKIEGKTHYHKDADGTFDFNRGTYSAEAFFAAIELELSFLKLTELGLQYIKNNTPILARQTIFESIKLAPAETQKKLLYEYQQMHNY